MRKYTYIHMHTHTSWETFQSVPISGMKYSSQPSVPSYSAMLSVCCLDLVSYTISLTLGVKVFFSCCCPTSSALLHFSILFSFALPLSDSLLLSLSSCLPSSFFFLCCPLASFHFAFHALCSANNNNKTKPST